MSRGGFRRSQKGRACLRRADFRVFSPGIVFEAGDERPNLEKRGFQTARIEHL